MQSKIVILGTGGTIAGTAADPADALGYRAAQLGVAELAAAVPGLRAVALETEQLAQIDSKDMSYAVWQRLALCCAEHLARADVAGVVVTHGTDTLEETAYFLHRVLAPRKPLVLTAAMRPATSVEADGPQNLLDAVTLAREPGVGGVLVVLAGAVHGAADVRKAHTQRLDAFDSGAAGPVARIQQGRVRRLRSWPDGEALGLDRVRTDVSGWPRVELLLSYAAVGAGLVPALVAQGVQGLVVAGTGNGTLHADLEAALRAAQQAGVRVLRASRCARGAVLGDDPAALPSAGALAPLQARIELLLQLLAA
jgi:L-asparaginase